MAKPKEESKKEKLDKVKSEIKELEKGATRPANRLEKDIKLKEKIEKKIAIEKIKDVKATGVFGGFFEFLQKYSVIGLAIGLVIGDSSKLLVNKIVTGLINPFIGLFLPNKTGLQGWVWTVRGQKFELGNVLLETINFIIILFVIYFVIKILLRKEDWIEPKK